MVDIISRRSGPRPEDERIRRVIEANRPTIDALANQLTDGGWSRRQQQPKAAPQPEGLIIHTARATARTEPARPYVRVAVNGRVSLVDLNTGVQMHHVGDLRRRDGVQSFRLATAENGFFSPVDPEIAGLLADLDGQPVSGTAGERQLVAAIGERLHI